MYGPLALLVVATALFGAGVVWRRVRGPRRTVPAARVDLEQVQGFVFVGSGALVLLAVGVLVLGLAGHAGEAEATGVLGLLAYLVYLLVAVLLVARTARRSARRSAGWSAPPEPGQDPSGAGSG